MLRQSSLAALRSLSIMLRAARAVCLRTQLSSTLDITMNIQTAIPDAMWTAVANAYEAENYSHAILEATYLISAVLRERAGVDGDGSALVASSWRG